MKVRFITLLFSLCLSSLSGQKPKVLMADNPLLHNVTALQETHSFILHSGTNYQHTSLIDPVAHPGFTGKTHASIHSIARLNQEVGARYGILKGLEAQIGFRHNLTFRNYSKNGGERFTDTQTQWSNWVIGGRFSRYIPKSDISIGLQLSLVGEFFPSEFYFSTTGVVANLLLGKVFNEHHQLTGGLGFHSVFNDELPISLCYTYSPVQQLGFYAKGAYSIIFSYIGGGDLYSVDFGGGAYYCISDQWRVDLAVLSIKDNYPNTNLKNPFEMKLGVAAAF